jgi:hypothetical protein
MRIIDTFTGYNRFLPDRRTGLSLLLLTAITLLVYSPVLWNDFLYYWDDQWQVMNHFTEGGINAQNLWAILTGFYGGQYSPVCQYLYLILYSMFGYNPLPFHLLSLLLHTGCVVLVYAIVKKLIYDNEHARLISFITALLFAVHPMNVETVAWISADKITAYAFFYLSAIFTYIIFLNKNGIQYYIVSAVLFVLSFGSKEQAVTLPVCLLVLYLIKGYSLKDKKVWIQLAPLFALSVVFGIITMLSQASNNGGVLSGQETYPLWQRIVLACYSFIEYVTKFFLPYNLLYIYPFPMRNGEALPDWMLVYPALVLIFSTAFWKYLSRGVLAAGLTFFVVHIAITLHIIPMSRFVVIADRYIYLACIGLAFIVSSYFVKLITTVKGTARKSSMVAGLFIALFLGAYSNMRCRDWKNTDTIKREIRELIKQRDDYVPEQFEKLMEEEDTEKVSNSLIRKEFRQSCPMDGKAILTKQKFTKMPVKQTKNGIYQKI